MKSSIKGTSRRWLAFLLSFCMLVSQIPMTVYAEPSVETTTLCEHHTEHSLEICGYEENLVNAACAHEHADECYTKTAACKHEHDDLCMVTETVQKATPSEYDKEEELEICTHVCGEECYEVKEACEHQHDDQCGYDEDKLVNGCTYQCEECAAKNEEVCDMTEDCEAKDHEAECPVAILEVAKETFREMLNELPAPEDIDPLDEEQMEELHGEIQELIEFALENGLYENQDEVTSLAVVAAVLEAMYAPEAAVNDTINPDYSWYIGKTTPFEISTVDQLVGLAKITQGSASYEDTNGATVNITKDDFAGKTVILANDITIVDGQYWYVRDNNKDIVDYCIKDFAGTFDGNDKIISGLNIKSERATSQIGLFKNITSTGEVMDLILDGVSFELTDGNSSIGSIAGQFFGTATNCHVKNVTVNVGMNKEARGYIAQGGGIFGYIKSATVEDCTATTVNMTFSGNDNTDRVGALIGQVDGTAESRSTIDNCHVDGAKFTLTMKAKKFGAFVGQTNYVDVNNCTISGIDIFIADWGYWTGGFVGYNANGSVYTECKVLGGKIVVESETSGSCVGGFAGYNDANPAKFENCSVSGLSIEIECIPGLHGQAGGFVGRLNNEAIAINCTVSGTITTKGEGDISSSVGGFAGDIRASFTGTNCDASGMVINASATNANAGGFVGRVNERNGEKTITLTNCTGASSVSSGGAAGGLVGYMDFSSNVTFDSCTPTTESSVTGAVTNPVANAKQGEYEIDTNGEISFTKSVCSGTVDGYAIGYPSVQDAVDAGANEITLLQNISGDFILENRSETTEFILNLGEFTFNGTIHIHNKIQNFTANGSAEGSRIVLTGTLGVHNVFEGWCYGTDSRQYANKTEDGIHWIAELGKTYHPHVDNHTDYDHLEEATRNLNFGTKDFDTNVNDSKSVIFTYSGSDQDQAKIIAFEGSPYFTATVDESNPLKAVITPKQGLNAGIYENETIYVIMHDGSSHEIWATITVNGIASDVQPATQDSVNGTYGEHITLSVKVAVNSRTRTAGQNQVVFTYGDTVLGESTITYDDETQTSGTASIDYDTTAGVIPVGENNEVTIEYGGSINLLESTGTILVNLEKAELTVDGLTVDDREFDGTTIVTVDASAGILNGIYLDDDVTIASVAASVEDASVGENKAVEITDITLSGVKSAWYTVKHPTDLTVTITIKTIAAGTTETVNGVSITGPATVDQNGAYVTDNGKIEIGGKEFTVTSGPVTIKNDGTVEVLADMEITNEDGLVISGNAAINRDGSATVTAGGSIQDGSTIIEVTTGSATVKTDGTVEVPADSIIETGDQIITGPASIGEDGNVTIQTNGKIEIDDKEYIVTTGPVTVEGNEVTIPDGSVVNDGKSTITGPATADPNNDVQELPVGSSTSVGNTTVEITTGSVSANADGSVTIPENSTAIVDGITITGPASVNADGNATAVQTDGKVIIDGKEYTVINGPVSVTDGKLTIPENATVSDGTNTIAGPTIVDQTSTEQEFTAGSTIIAGDNSVEITEGSVVVKEDGTVEITTGSIATVNNLTVSGPAAVSADGKTVTVQTGGTIIFNDMEYIVVTGPITVTDGMLTIPENCRVSLNGQTVVGPTILGVGEALDNDSEEDSGDDTPYESGWVLRNNIWYYLDETGKKQTGWILYKGCWYYLNPDNGDMMINWQFINGRWYYLNPANGDMMTGWHYINGKWYYMDPINGYMKIGWQYINEKWYYLHTVNGDMYANSMTPDGYYVDENGAWIP